MTTYITYSELCQDALDFAKALPRQFVGVLGIARSGMIPATVIAQHWNVPLGSFDTFLATGSFFSGGVRDTQRAESGPVLVVDDSIYGGSAMAKARKQWEAAGIVTYTPTWSAIYSLEPGAYGCLTHKIAPSPRFFDWNWAHHSALPSTMSDIDGILCHDPPVFDDDGVVYEQSIINAVPLYIPTVKVHTLISMRLERWRAITEAWLERHGVQYKSLILCPCKSAAERRAQGGYGEFKAQHYMQSRCNLFVESDPKQAEVIAKVSGKPVICPPIGKGY